MRVEMKQPPVGVGRILVGDWLFCNYFSWLQVSTRLSMDEDSKVGISSGKRSCWDS